MGGGEEDEGDPDAEVVYFEDLVGVGLVCGERDGDVGYVLLIW